MNAAHFNFDPVPSSDEEDERREPAPDRRANLDWCTCGQCSIAPTNDECLCCRELTARGIAAKFRQLGTATCLTHHQTFVHGCTNIHALEIAYYQFMEDRGSQIRRREIHERYRYTAYRQFARWIWHRLGRGRRVVLPRCVVEKIRQAFPSESYTGFRYPRY